MTTRPAKVVVAAVVALAAATAVLAAVAVAGASSGGRPEARPAASRLTWHAASRRVRFPVYRPRQTLGLSGSGLLLHDGCLLAGWGTRKGAHFGLYEPGNSVQCGQPGEAASVGQTVVNGVRVHILVQCSTLPKCTIRDGERKGELLIFVPEKKPSHYTIQLQSMHVALRDFLRVARSFHRVH
jgi:hypothetical protein